MASIEDTMTDFVALIHIALNADFKLTASPMFLFSGVYVLRVSQKPTPSSYRIQVPNTVKTSSSLAQSEIKSGYSPYSLPFPRQPAFHKAGIMAVEPDTLKKNHETVTGATRMSLISPPQDGRMGHISGRTIPGPLRSSKLGSSQQINALRQFSQDTLQANKTAAWDMSTQRTPQLYQRTPQSSQSTVIKHPISLSGFLQKRP
ncbi:Hypothetical predicted protein [Pelobates cultripes]|uniref:Uncharacterized protein n=1 Tax=Pelobates cultripes TaxID=61616 RepID=A0AAD1SIQ7_PELCU|nr:Hypothetical predicted protein [Pelobates cultripes]